MVCSRGQSGGGLRSLAVVAAFSLLAGCAAGPKVSEGTPGGQVGGTLEGMKGVSTVHLMVPDSSVHAYAARRISKATGLRVAGSPLPDTPVLSLQFDCGNDFVFMGRAIEHPYCNMLNEEQIVGRVTPPETTGASCLASVVLTQGGQPLWWFKDTVRVGTRSDLVSATDRMIDHFTAAWLNSRR